MLVAGHINNRNEEITLERHAIELLAASLHNILRWPLFESGRALKVMYEEHVR